MIIDHDRIATELDGDLDADKTLVREILCKAKELHGISHRDVLILLKVHDPALTQELFETAKYVKEQIYGNRLVLFAPLYISNLCNNECLYCAFRNQNQTLPRRALSLEEIKAETVSLIEQGHKRILLVAGESYPKDGMDYVINAINTIYNARSKQKTGNIRRVNVNIAPLPVDDYRKLKDAGIGTYQLFQETYHEATYKKLHIRGPKSHYDKRLQAISNAITAGLTDVGIGVLFGLYDYRYEILAMLSHIAYLESEFGMGPHTISVPRLEPAHNSPLSAHPPHALSDDDFKKVIAVLRLAIPYTGIILSTRESSAMRKDAFELGISQISAGSKTNPGGYHAGPTNSNEDAGQFTVGDTRPLAEVIKDMVKTRHIPSFCTGCYRLGRVGSDFMDLAKPGLIRQHCLPNAIFTFAEYLEDFAEGDAGRELYESGYQLIEEMLTDFPDTRLQARIRSTINHIRRGERDIYF